jgi:hypothetical protein
MALQDLYTFLPDYTCFGYYFSGAAQDSLSVMKTGIRFSGCQGFSGSSAACTRAVPKAW